MVNYEYLYTIHKVIVLIGLLLFFNVAYLFSNKPIGHNFIKYSSLSFAIFALHEPLMSLIKRIIGIYIPYINQTNLFLNYVLVFLSTLLICWILALLVKKYLPNFSSIAFGGR
jgi:peptidoglycan/LPS O-acetylase OafA/YrhL